MLIDFPLVTPLIHSSYWAARHVITPHPHPTPAWSVVEAGTGWPVQRGHSVQRQELGRFIRCCYLK